MKNYWLAFNSKAFLLIALIFKLNLSIAQEETVLSDLLLKKHNLISLESSGSIADEITFNYQGINFAHFIRNRLYVGIELGRSFYGDWERNYNFAPNARYYYASFKRFSYFVDGKAQLGFTSYANELTLSEWKGKTFDLSLSTGISYNGFFKKKIGIEFFAGYLFDKQIVPEHPYLGRYVYSRNDIIYGIKLNYHFKLLNRNAHENKN